MDTRALLDKLNYIIVNTIILDKNLLKEKITITEPGTLVKIESQTIEDLSKLFYTDLGLRQSISLSKETVDFLQVDNKNFENTLKLSMLSYIENLFTKK